MLKRGSSILIIFACGILAGVVLTAILKKPPAPKIIQAKLPDEFFAVYGYDDQANYEQINYYVRIPKSLPLEEKLKRLANETSRLAFGGRTLEFKGIKFQANKKIAVINIQEDERFDLKNYDRKLYAASWFGGAFQGSAGGSATRYTLLETFLQPDYKGQWIEGIEYLYNGEKLPEQIAHLTLGESPYLRKSYSSGYARLRADK